MLGTSTDNKRKHRTASLVRVHLQFGAAVITICQSLRTEYLALLFALFVHVSKISQNLPVQPYVRLLHKHCNSAVAIHSTTYRFERHTAEKGRAPTRLTAD